MPFVLDASITLAWYFPVVDGRKAEIVVHWGATAVPLEIQVP